MNTLLDLNNYYDAYKASMRGSSWKAEPQRFERNFLTEIVKLKHEVESRTYKTSTGSEFILNERGKTRLVHGGRMRDRVIRHVLADDVLTDAMSPYLIYTNTASQKGKGVGLIRHCFETDLHNYYLEFGSNDGYVGFFDFSKFYDNIVHDTVYDIVEDKIDDLSAWLLREIITAFEIDVSYMTEEEFYDCMNEKFDSIKYYLNVPKEYRTGTKMMRKSVDIGDQISQNIGVFYPIRVDNYVKIVRGHKRYGRYCDDGYIIHQSKDYIQDTIDGVADLAYNELGLFLNNKKTRIYKLSDVYKFLQIRYSLSDTGRVIKRINPRSIKREKDRLKAYKRLYDAGEMSYEKIENNFKSYMGSNAKIMSRKQIESMNELCEQLFQEVPRWKN